MLVFVFWVSGLDAWWRELLASNTGFVSFLEFANNECWVIGAWSWDLGFVVGQDGGTREANVVASGSQHPARICTWVLGGVRR